MALDYISQEELDRIAYEGLEFCQFDGHNLPANSNIHVGYHIEIEQWEILNMNTGKWEPIDIRVWVKDIS